MPAIEYQVTSKLEIPKRNPPNVVHTSKSSYVDSTSLYTSKTSSPSISRAATSPASFPPVRRGTRQIASPSAPPIPEIPHFYACEEQSDEEPLEVFFTDVQKLQAFSEKISEMSLHLERNGSIARILRDLNNRYHDEREPTPAGRVQRAYFNNAIEATLVDLELLKRNVENLLNRVQGRARLVSSNADQILQRILIYCVVLQHLGVSDTGSSC